MLYNRERALELMREHDVAAMIGTTLENVTYLTGHIGWAQRVYRARKSYGVMTNNPDAGTDLIMNRADNTYYAAYGGHAENVYVWGGQANHIEPEGYEPHDEEMRRYRELHASGAKHATLLDGLLAALRDRGITSGRIALDEEGCPDSLFATLKEKLPNCEFIPGSGLFLMTRLVKTADELDRLREAAQVNEDAITKVFEFVCEGVSEREVAEVWRQEVARPGGMWHWFHFNSGPRGVFIFPPTDRKLQKGDGFMFDAGLFHKNYNADTGSCGSIGEPSARVQREWKGVEEGFHECLEVIKAGCTGNQIYQALVKGIQSRFPEFDAPFAGHTIGLEAREFPFILGPESKHNQPFYPETSEIPYPVDSVINIEAPIGTFGQGGYQIEYSVVVKENGWEMLIPQDRSFRVIDV